MTFADTLRRHEVAIRATSRWLVYAMLAVPLLVGNGYFFPFIVPKYIAFRVLVELLVLGYLLLLAANPDRYRPRMTWATWAVIAYGLSAIVSGALGVNFHYSFWGTFERMESIFTTLHYVVLFLVLPAIFDRQTMLRALRVSVAFGVLLSLYGLAQKAGASWTVETGRDRISATVGNPAYVGAYLLFQMGFAAYLALHEWATKRRWLWLAALAVLLPTFVLTLTRGAMLGFLAALPLAAVLWLWLSRHDQGVARVRRWVAALLAVAVVVPVALVLARNTSFVRSTPILQRFTDISPTAGTAITRFYTWNSAWQGIQERPILGWGPEQFPVPFNKYINPLHYKGPNSETWFDHAHNIILDIGVTQGAVGVLVWLAFIGGLLAMAWRLARTPGQRSLGLVATCLLVAYVIQNMFLFDVLVVWMLLALLGCLLLVNQPPKPPVDAAANQPSVLGVLPWIYVAGLLLWLLPVNVRTAGVSKAVIVGKEMDGAADQLMTFDWYQDKVFSRPLGTGSQEAPRQASASFLDRIQTSRFKDAEQRNKALAIVQPPLEAAWHAYPYDLQTPIALAKLVALNGEASGDSKGLEQAIAIVQEARKFSPQRIELLNDLGLYQMALNRTDEAVATYEEVSRLTQGVPMSRWSLGFAYLRQGRNEDAEREMMAALQDVDFKAFVFANPNMLRRLVGLYVDQERWADLAELYRNIVTLEPQNAETWGALALTYQKLNDYDRGIAAAQEAARIEPQFREAAEGLIAELRAAQAASQRRR